MVAQIDDTYAEVFRSIYCRILITAKSKKWLDHAVDASTGNATSSILCDCEAGFEAYTDGKNSVQTPDGRLGVVVQLHVPRFWKDREKKLEKAALVRISQNILTCPTTSCFNLIDSENNFHMGKKVAYFGNRFQKRITRFDRKLWWIPILAGEFVMDRILGFATGIMGGNLWFLGKTEDAALLAAERGVKAINAAENVITTFPGGIASSGSKAGSSYPFTIASTYEKYCPMLQGNPKVDGSLPPGVNSVMEIIINGSDLESINKAMQSAIHASQHTEDLIMISAGNYGGRLGKNLIYLLPKNH